MKEDAENDRKREVLVEKLKRSSQKPRIKVTAKETEVKQKTQELAKAQAEIVGLGLTNRALRKQLTDVLAKLHKPTENLDGLVLFHMEVSKRATQFEAYSLFRGIG